MVNKHGKTRLHTCDSGGDAQTTKTQLGSKSCRSTGPLRQAGYVSRSYTQASDAQHNTPSKDDGAGEQQDAHWGGPFVGLVVGSVLLIYIYIPVCVPTQIKIWIRYTDTDPVGIILPVSHVTCPLLPRGHMASKIVIQVIIIYLSTTPKSILNPSSSMRPGLC